jgi:UDP-N-acetylmuramate--alanine ligase
MTLQDFVGKSIHFIGVGGIGMSGLAQLLHTRGFLISGSDLSFNSNIERLKKIGIDVVLGHNPATLDGKEIIVLSTDIKETNLELQQAQAKNLPIFHRADILAMLMREKAGIAISGTHGKTTTTALTGWVLEKAGLDPTVVNGGVMNTWDSNIRAGQGKWCVAEADESDGSFLKLPRQISLITNIDPEHMDHYGSFEKLLSAFERFSSEGIAILGIDHPHVYTLWQKIKDTRPCITYGIHTQADVRAESICLTPTGSSFDLVKEDKKYNISLSLFGYHNVLNALAAAAIAFHCGVRMHVLREAFSSFTGVQRRFTVVGQWKGITIVDDYAHHPTEIRATLLAARGASQGRVIAILEPHRYSRVAHHFQDFVMCCEEADLTIILPIYAARELPLEGITHQALAAAMKGEVYCCDDPQHLPSLIQSIARTGDILMCLGAGSISSFARALPVDLNKVSEQIRA